LSDQDSQIREDAAIELNVRHDPRTVPFLIKALNDPDSRVVVITIDSLHSLTKQPYMVKSTASDAMRNAVANKYRLWWRVAKSHWPVDNSLTTVVAFLPAHSDTSDLSA
jgi:hypothetical protein